MLSVSWRTWIKQKDCLQTFPGVCQEWGVSLSVWLTYTVKIIQLCFGIRIVIHPLISFQFSKVGLQRRQTKAWFRAYGITCTSGWHHRQHLCLCKVHYVLITLWSCPGFLYAAVTANKTPGLGLFPPILCCSPGEGRGGRGEREGGRVLRAGKFFHFSVHSHSFR